MSHCFFEATDDEIKRRGYQLVLAEKGALRSWLSEIKVDERRLALLWPRCIAVQARIFVQERPFFHGGLSFEHLIDDLLDNETMRVRCRIASLSAVNFAPTTDLWVLEIQIRHPERQIGAFYEDLLLD